MPQTILIVASDPNIIYLLLRYAEASGFEAMTTRQQQDIGAVVQKTRPAVIILEDDFPGTLYRAAFDHLKSVPATKTIPVILYSCLDATADERVKGASGFLRQSVTYEDFLGALEQAGVRPARKH